MERYLRVNLLGPGPRLIKKRIYRAAVSQELRNTALEWHTKYFRNKIFHLILLTRNKTQFIETIFGTDFFPKLCSIN